MRAETTGRRWVVAVALAAVVSVAGIVGAAIAAAHTASRRQAADEAAAALAADRLSTELTAIASSITGVDGLSIDGTVTDAEFHAFAADVMRITDLSALAFAVPVDGADRPAWEAAIGHRISDTDGQGGFTEAPNRAEHVAVRFVEPDTADVRAAIGFDLMSDPVRAAGVMRAREHREVAVVGPLLLANSARPGLFVVNGAHRADGVIVGYVAGGFPLDRSVDELEAIPGVDRVGVTIDDVELVGLDGAGGSATFEHAGRTFSIAATSTDRPAWTLPTMLAIAAAAVCGATAWLAQRALLDRRRQADRAGRAALLAGLPDQLAHAGTAVEALQEIADRAGAVVGARHAVVGRRAPGDPSRWTLAHESTGDSLLPREEIERLLLGDGEVEALFGACARSGETVLVATRAGLHARYPSAMPAARALGVHAVCCAPLGVSRDGRAAVVGFVFDLEIPVNARDAVETSAALVGQMAGRALERALGRELLQERLDRMRTFAGALTSTRSSDDVAACVAELVPPLLDLDDARIITTPSTSVDEPTDRWTTAHPLTIEEGGEIVVRRRRGTWTSIDDTVLSTVTDLVEGALTRTRLHDQEQVVLRRFQESLFTPAPEVDGLDIGVGYRTAVESVGMGGDWYSVVDTDDAVFAVIGDVAGHGPGAVAVMAEAKTIMRHLLTNGSTIGDTLEHAHRAMIRRRGHASAAIVRIDKDSGRIDYVNAGHPPMLRYHRHGATTSEIETLDIVHRPWLGVEAPGVDGVGDSGGRAVDGATEAPAAPAAISELAVGDVLLLYTDGLVEVRGEPIDVSIRRQLHDLDVDQPAAAMVNHLLSRREQTRTSRSIDDDVAVVVVKRVSPSVATR